MIIAIIQKDNDKIYRWGTFDSAEKAVEFVRYILHSVKISAIPSFTAVVATPEGITEYSLADYEKSVNR